MTDRQAFAQYCRDMIAAHWAARNRAWPVQNRRNLRRWVSYLRAMQ